MFCNLRFMWNLLLLFFWMIIVNVLVEFKLGFCFNIRVMFLLLILEGFSGYLLLIII